MPKLVGYMGASDLPAMRFEWLPTIMAGVTSYALAWLASTMPGRSLMPNTAARLSEYEPEVLAKFEAAIRSARSGERSAPVPDAVMLRLSDHAPGRFSYDLSPETRYEKKVREYKQKTSLRGAVRSTSKASSESEHPHLLIDTRGEPNADGTYQRAKPVLLRAYRADGKATFMIESGDVDLSKSPLLTKVQRSTKKQERAAQRAARAAEAVKKQTAREQRAADAAQKKTAKAADKAARKAVKQAPAPVIVPEILVTPTPKMSRRAKKQAADLARHAQQVAAASLPSLEVPVLVPPEPAPVVTPASAPGLEPSLLPKPFKRKPKPAEVAASEQTVEEKMRAKEHVRRAGGRSKTSPIVRAALGARHVSEPIAADELAPSEEIVTMGTVLSIGGGPNGTAKITWDDGTVTTHPAAYFTRHGLGVGSRFGAVVVLSHGRPIRFAEIYPEYGPAAPAMSRSPAKTSAAPRTGLGFLVEYIREKARVIWEDDGTVSLTSQAPFLAAGIRPRSSFVATLNDDGETTTIEPAPEGTPLSYMQADTLERLDKQAGLKSNKTSRRRKRLARNAVRWGRQAAGLLIIARDTQRMLLMRRSENVLEPHTWALPGGRCESDDSDLRACAVRELREETGYGGALSVFAQPVHVYREPDFEFHDFVGFVDHEFEPELDWENEDAGWFSPSRLPSPAHFGVRELFQVAGRQIRALVSQV